MAGGWLLRPRLRPTAMVRLFCLPSAGCGPSMFHGWAAALPDTIEVIGVGLPGRESLISEPLLNGLPEIANQIIRAMEPLLDRPYALFGHSMGAWLAYELCHQLRRNMQPMPRRLMVSGRRAPHLPPRRSPLRGLGDAELLAEVQKRYGGISDAVLAEPELMKLLLPVLRTDITAVETYVCPDEPPLQCNIDSFGGLQDDEINEDELQAWAIHTLGSFSVKRFSGGHFYLQEPSSVVLLNAIAESTQHDTTCNFTPKSR